MSVVSEIEKGKSLPLEREEAKQRSRRWTRNSTGFSLSRKRGGNAEKKWLKEGKQQGGAMTDGLHSVSRSLSMINEV